MNWLLLFRNLSGLILLRDNMKTTSSINRKYGSIKKRKRYIRMNVYNFFKNGKIETTIGKAKMLLPVLEKKITQIIKSEKDLQNNRKLTSYFFDRKDLISSSKKFYISQSRRSGFLRLRRTRIRMGDGSIMAEISNVQNKK